ncbi:MAG TPA: formate-dependent phosphoribosylglycinamide formyltransferase [Ignavibacteria bacterium]|nr:phosphoribosylglycinamide formyltransferase 2 [Bacteroidota bacterium]HRI84743.1 formate-dependent phosphoribosylglycinamide formyltransferase [Ignavibacteria bacterium]HRJ99478.1 formate-dependent phosphoribosylglycinamide formyltransferase [Ignavibacteria bacterium]HRK00066.1 formate-dependent phosphoribosylglycinamide formyltransferase [Ignavibacteria bacterium]
MIKKFLLLGSGELGKEFTIAAKRLGQFVIAVDSYSNAPAQQVADDREVINMLDGNELDRIVEKHKPDIIVPEIEAVRTERLYDYEKSGIVVVPSAKAANFTMNRKEIRDLASKELNIKTAKYEYAASLEKLRNAAEKIGYPCVIKPLMSSSGKGQSFIKDKSELQSAWDRASSDSRGDFNEVIVEEFIDFQSEITLLTVTQRSGKTLYCPPIGHRQERGDYQESWQPADIPENLLVKACDIAHKITESLTGYGIWGVEFFIGKEEVYFSELSPRPHDTGMVTLADTQNLNEFELHLRAVLGLPINEILLQRSGASSVILSDKIIYSSPGYEGIDNALKFKNSDIRIFGKPNAKIHRRMGVALTWGETDSDINALRKRAKEISDSVIVTE